MILIEANYSKKVGLPQFSSHQYSVTVRSEISDLTQVEAESARLYALLQTSVDRELQNTGFVPHSDAAVNGHSNGAANGYSRNGTKPRDTWQCSFKQRQLIERIIEENQLEGTEVEDLARERFNLPVNRLNKLQASGLIEELFATYSGKRYPSRGNPGNGYRREYANGGGR